MSVIVVGGGIAGLVGARELLRQGEVVDLYEAADHLGGLIAPHSIGDLVVDGGADAFALRTSVVADLCEELGLEIAEPHGHPHIWWPEAPHRWPIADGVLGIPASIDDPALAAALTADELAVASEDLTMGGDVAADETMLGPLVAARLGPSVLERLVEPVTRGVYGRSPSEVEVDRVAPGLRAALRQHGSLTAAVAATRTPGDASVAQPIGGLYRLVEELAADVETKGGRIHTGNSVTRLEHDGYSWEVRTRTGPQRADRVVLAVSARAAARLLELLGVTFEVPPTHPGFQAVLSLSHPGVAVGPVGSGVIEGRRDPRLVAQALTHYSLKWPWSAQPDRDVLRLAYTLKPTLGQALADASLLMGVDLAPDDVVDFTVIDWEMPSAMPPAARTGLLEKLTRFEGLAVTGAWVAGNGIAAVVRAAQEVVA